MYPYPNYEYKNLPMPFKGVGYDQKWFLRTGTGNRICPNTIMVLVTGTGIYFLTFRFWSIRNQNFKSLFRFRLNFETISYILVISGLDSRMYRNIISLLWFRLNQNRKLDFTGFRPEITRINFPINLIYSKRVY